MEGRSTATCHVVAIPYPGRGHINPMLNLCKTLASKNHDISITFVLTDEWLGLLGDKPKPANIVFSTIPNVVPSERVRAREMDTFLDAVFTKMEAPFKRLLDRLDHQPDLIMADTNLFWAVGVGNLRNIPVASFWPMSSAVFCTYHQFYLLHQNGQNPFDLRVNGDERVLNKIPGVSSTTVADLPRVANQQSMQRIVETFSWAPKVQFVLLSSVYELEHEPVDALKAEFHIPVYTVGPCIPYPKLEDRSSVEASQRDGVDYIMWLDKQPRNSVLYISQGSYLSVSRDQMSDIAAGLRDSGVRFLWVGREESSRVKELCGEMGMVVPWCDQLEVLSHSSVGGFWTHCGWNSIKEGVFAGVPFLTSPIAYDQMPNSKVVVQDWKIGWWVKNKSREGIADLVRRFMDLQDDEGREMRRGARQLQQVCRTSVGKGGSCERSIDAFIENIINGLKD